MLKDFGRCSVPRHDSPDEAMRLGRRFKRRVGNHRSVVGLVNEPAGSQGGIEVLGQVSIGHWVSSESVA